MVIPSNNALTLAILNGHTFPPMKPYDAHFPRTRRQNSQAYLYYKQWDSMY